MEIGGIAITIPITITIPIHTYTYNYCYNCNYTPKDHAARRVLDSERSHSVIEIPTVRIRPPFRSVSNPDLCVFMAQLMAIPLQNMEKNMKKHPHGLICQANETASQKELHKHETDASSVMTTPQKMSSLLAKSHSCWNVFFLGGGDKKQINSYSWIVGRPIQEKKQQTYPQVWP